MNENEKDKQHFTYKEVLAMIFAAYQVILPRALSLFISIFIIALCLKIFFR